MRSESYLYLIPVLTYILVSLTVAKKPASEAPNRFVQLDGLRGFLALGVVVCHAHTWFFYGKDGQFIERGIALDVQLGRVPVALFFAITSFLFINNLLRSPDPSWRRYVIGRLFRLIPVFAAVGVIAIGLVHFRNNGILRVSLHDFSYGSLTWLTACLFSTPLNLDVGEPSNRIIAGVDWTLRHEWLFYLTLPFIGFLLSKKRTLRYFKWVIVTIGVIVVTARPILFSVTNLQFIPGAVVAVIYHYRRAWMERWVTHRAFGWVTLVSFVTILVMHWSQWMLLPITMMLGCTIVNHRLTSILSFRGFQYLGQQTYSIYLTHGLVMYIMFTHVTGREWLHNVSAYNYWVLMGGNMLLILGLSHVLHVFVELPAIELGRCIVLRTDSFGSFFKRK